MPDIETPLSPSLELALLKGYEKTLKARMEILRQQVQKQMEEGDVTTMKPRINGEPVATISWSEGKSAVVITNEAAFTAYVRKYHPTEMVEQVAMSFRGKVAGEVARHGNYADPDGVLQDWIEVQRGRPYITVTPTEYGEELGAGSQVRLVEQQRQAGSGLTDLLAHVDRELESYPEGWTHRTRPIGTDQIHLP
jgi:hypothetical protein